MTRTQYEDLGLTVTTYDQLSGTLQAEARRRAEDALLTAICEGLRFNDTLNGDDLQARIDAAMERADEMQTPWFAHEYVMDTCAVELRGMAQCDAEDAAYDEPDDPRVISGIIQREAVPA